MKRALTILALMLASASAFAETEKAQCDQLVADAVRASTEPSSFAADLYAEASTAFLKSCGTKIDFMKRVQAGVDKHTQDTVSQFKVDDFQEERANQKRFNSEMDKAFEKLQHESESSRTLPMGSFNDSRPIEPTGSEELTEPQANQRPVVQTNSTR